MLDRGEVSSGRLDVYFPHTGILFLSSTDSTPDKMVMHTSGGDSRYFVEVMKESDFDLDKVFENELYFLLPFYSFNYKNEFEDIEKDEDKQEQFINVYRNIIDMLEELVSEEMLSTFSKDVIISLINKVSYKQLMKYQDTQKKVGDLMGGKVLDLDIIRAHDAGLEEGREEGIKKGMEKGIEKGRESTLASSIRSMMSKLKLSAEEAMDTLDIPKSERSKYMTML